MPFGKFRPSLLVGFTHSKRCAKVQDMASRSVNKVILVGNLGRDAETTFTPSGVARSKFSVATNRRVKDMQSGEWRDETEWVNVILWRGENVANFLTRGKQVYVEGRIQTRTYDDKDGKKQYFTEVVAEDVILLGGRGEGGGGGAEDFGGGMQSMPRSAQPAARPRPQQQSAPAHNDSFDAGISDDDVPF